MATISITPKTNKIKFGEKSTVSATVTNAAETASIEYSWKVNDVLVSETTNILSLTGDKIGNKSIGVTATITNEESEPEILTDTATLEIEKLNQNTEVSINSNKTSILTNEQTTITVDVTKYPSNSTISYKWFKNNNVVVGETGNSISVEFLTASTIKFKCEILVVAKNYNDFSATTTEHSIAVKNRTLTATASIEPVETSINTGNSIEIEVLTNNPQSANVTYEWSTRETTQKIKFPGSISGSFEVSCVVTFTKDGYDVLVSPKLTSKISVSIDKKGVKYIHPLESRNSAYLWSGWWVMDEIQRAVKENINWKDQNANVKYKDDMKTIAYILENYPNVEIQESRNGYILNKKAIENGDIYK